MTDPLPGSTPILPFHATAVAAMPLGPSVRVNVC